MPPAVRAVHQVIPSLHVADATGTHTLYAREALREAGYSSEIFAEHVDQALAEEAHPLSELDRYMARSRSAILYQLAVGWRHLDSLVRRSEPLVVNYHNLTPADFYWKWAPDWLNGVEMGRQQLHGLARRALHAIAVSEFNARDLVSAGYSSTSVVPPFVDVSLGNAAEMRDDATWLVRTTEPRSRRNGGPHSGARWLFVGKLLPHKAAHDLLKALALYRLVYDPDARLEVVGAHPVPAYTEAVRSYARALGIEDALSLPGRVSADELSSSYLRSDVFVCLSEHEGFCFPLLESMRHELPVVALDAGAVAGTLADAGVLLPDKRPGTVAAAVHLMMCDRVLRSRMVEAGRRRLDAFDLEQTKRAFARRLDEVLEAAST